MDFLRKTGNNRIIKIQLISLFSNQVLDVTPVEGDFSTSEEVAAEFDNVYFTIETPYLTEDSEKASGGFLHELKFGFSFPTNEDRTTIINRFKYLKLIRVWFCSGKYTDIGRNDYRQNKALEGSFSTSENFTDAEWTAESIFPFKMQ